MSRSPLRSPPIVTCCTAERIAVAMHRTFEDLQAFLPNGLDGDTNADQVARRPDAGDPIGRGATACPRPTPSALPAPAPNNSTFSSCAS